jgi:hydroxyacylglutathione hydrolase
MKNTLLKKSWIALLAFFILLALNFGCSNPNQKKLNPAYAKWFTIKKVADKVWSISDHGADNFYLVEGTDSALLIDNGIGVVNVRDFVSQLTNLPLIVVNTHGHPDHGGANYQFPLVYVHPADFELLDFFGTKEQRQKERMNMPKGDSIPKGILFPDTITLKPTVLRPIRQGYTFNLGNRKLEVIEVPGHTFGSICLLDAKNKLLFTGDNDNTLVWLFLEKCEPLEVYLESLKNLNKRKAEFDTLYPGHNMPIDKAFIDEQITCVENILNGQCQPKPYHSFVGDGMVCEYKRASVVYNPDNLRVKK